VAQKQEVGKEENYSRIEKEQEGRAEIAGLGAVSRRREKGRKRCCLKKREKCEKGQLVHQRRWMPGEGGVGRFVAHNSPLSEKRGGSRVGTQMKSKVKERMKRTGRG